MSLFKKAFSKVNTNRFAQGAATTPQKDYAAQDDVWADTDTTVRLYDEEQVSVTYTDKQPTPAKVPINEKPATLNTGTGDVPEDDYAVDGQLAVDVYDLGDSFLIKTMTAGVRKEDLEISLTRDKVGIRGSRYADIPNTEGTYILQELYWGTFARTVTLPDEVDIDLAEAREHHGLLTLRLPKMDTARSKNLKVI